MGEITGAVKLMEDEAHLRDLIDTLDLAAVMVREMDGTIRFWSRGCERLYGWTAEEALGRISHDLLGTGFPLPLRELENTLHAAGEWHGDLSHVRRDGTRLVAAAHKVLRRDPSAGRLIVMESIADVTDLRQAQAELVRLNAELELRVEARTEALMLAEAKLRQAQKMEAVGQLTGGVAHDFNNLLTIVLNSVEMAERRRSDPEAVARYLESIRRAVSRGSRLTRHLLAFSRRQILIPEVAGATDMIRATLELASQALRQDIQFECDLPEDLPTILIDRANLELALMNVLINAQDAMPGGGYLHVCAYERTLDRDDLHGRYVVLRVADTGSGIPEDILPRVVEPFFTTKEVGKGSGLGLAQAYGFARQSGGTLEIDSTLGSGTTVTFYLPTHAE